ncbi:MAG: HlyC/CorC family transporter [Acidobacteriales bacterium]|nr:MAG: HlyC/CorC family transporter [Terriglobales bacterium]
MTIVLIAVAAWFAVSLALVTFVQVLYLESLRLRRRELPALTFFKETLQERIGLKSERGALVFSLVKHTTMALLGVVVLGISLRGPGATWQVLIEACLASWVIMLGATYVVPQVLYRKTEGRWILPLAPFLHALTLPARPVAATLRFFQSVVDLGDPEQNGEEPVKPEEHIDALISAGTEEGLIEEEDRKLIQAAVAFGDKTVREAMTPRPQIVAIEAGRSLDDLRQLVINEQYSRIPVYEGTIDRITGFIHVRDMFELDEEQRKQRTVRELIRPMRVVPETKPVNDLMKEMQEDRAHMVVVIDEYGNTAGLATMEDVVEEILGEIRDEHEPEFDVTPDGAGGYIVSGSCDLDRLHDLLGFRPQEEVESTTVSGLAAEWLGRVPAVGDVVEREGIRIEVLAGDERRVEQVRIQRSAEAAHE